MPSKAHTSLRRANRVADGAFRLAVRTGLRPRRRRLPLRRRPRLRPSLGVGSELVLGFGLWALGRLWGQIGEAAPTAPKAPKAPKAQGPKPKAYRRARNRRGIVRTRLRTVRRGSKAIRAGQCEARRSR